MIPYTKHQIVRKRDLNKKYFEILFRPEALNFQPGQVVHLYFDDENRDLFIASGIQEAWTRIIINRDLFPNFNFESPSLKLKNEKPVVIQGLMEEVNPSFLVTSDGIGPFFSYVSTYPDRKCKVCYAGGHRISEDWIKDYHEYTTIRDISKADNLYVIGNRDLLEQKAKRALKNCKTSYLI